MSISTALIRNVVIVIPGIMGSELVDARERPVWSVAPGSLVSSIRALAANALELPRDLGDDAAPDGVVATRLLGSLHAIPGVWTPVTGYGGLLGFLRSNRFHLIERERGNPAVVPNLIPFPYDWRLSNRHNARLLAKVACDALRRWRRQPGMEKAGLVLVCHSMGGLIARWFAEQEDGAECIRAIVTVGTPHRGSLNALVSLVNGIEPGFGPLRFSLSAFARSLPSLHQLLPQYACLEGAHGRIGLRDTPTPLDSTMLRDALDFHDRLDLVGPLPYKMHKVVGIRQPTYTTARLAGDRVIPSFEIDARDQGGDGTVPRMAAEPTSGRGDEVHEVAGQHGELQAASSMHDLVDGILTRDEMVWQSAPAEMLGIEMQELWSSDDEPHLTVDGGGDRLLLATVHDEHGVPVGQPTALAPDGRLRLARLVEGGYRVVVEAASPGGPAPIAKPFVVLDRR